MASFSRQVIGGRALTALLEALGHGLRLPPDLDARNADHCELKALTLLPAFDLAEEARDVSNRALEYPAPDAGYALEAHRFARLDRLRALRHEGHELFDAPPSPASDPEADAARAEDLAFDPESHAILDVDPAHFVPDPSG